MIQGNILRWVGAALFAALLSPPGSVAAEIKLLEDQGWTLTTDGRLGASYSYSKGTRWPENVNGGGLYGFEDASDSLSNSRIRSPFVPSILGLRLQMELVEDLVLTGRIALFFPIAVASIQNYVPAIDARELYMKLEGPWGAFTAGRDMSLFGRGETLMNLELAGQWGGGAPCTLDLAFAMCGHIGHGYVWSPFTAGFRYDTPNFAQDGDAVDQAVWSVGVYDPGHAKTIGYNISPLPRFESEFVLGRTQGDLRFKLWANAGWQRLARRTSDMTTAEEYTAVADALGYGGGVRIGMGPVELGGHYHQGQGLGTNVIAEDSDVTADQQGLLRLSRGIWLQSLLRLGPVRVGASWGRTEVDVTRNDINQDNPYSIITLQMGYAAGLYYVYSPRLSMGLDVFHADYEWSPGFGHDHIPPHQRADTATITTSMTW